MGWGYHEVDPHDEHEARRGRSPDLAADIMSPKELGNLKAQDKKRVASALSQRVGGVKLPSNRLPKRFIAGKNVRYR